MRGNLACDLACPCHQMDHVNFISLRHMSRTAARTVIDSDLNCGYILHLLTLVQNNGSDLSNTAAYAGGGK